MKKISFLIILLCAPNFCISQTAHGLSSDNNINQKISEHLIKEGFENVIVSFREKTVYVSYENRIYRNESEAAAKVIKIAAQYIEGEEEIILIPQFRNTPMITVKIPFKIIKQIRDKKFFQAILETIETSLETEPYWTQIKTLPLKNSTRFKADIVVSPQFKAQFGKYGHPIEYQFNAAPEIKTSLWKGMSFSSQVILPLHNELDSIGDNIRPGLITLNQFLRLPFNTFASATAGYFTENRLGVDLDLKKLLFNGKVSIGISAGYTGYTFFNKGTWYYSDEKVFTHLTSASYRHPQLDLNFKISYGKFLLQDKGWRFDVSRQFGETEIGFYTTRTDFGNNAGFNFSIPIFPSKYWKMETVRIRPAESFPWEYKYDLDDNARTYNTGSKIENIFKEFNPDFIKKELIISLKNILLN